MPVRTKSTTTPKAGSSTRAAKKRAEKLPKKRRALIVLGMHRSGTSALTRLVSLLGASLPRNLMPPRADNQTGFWESTDVMELNDEILLSGHSSWDDLFEFPRDWFNSTLAAPLAEKALNLLERDFSGSPLFVLKDPRMCRLLPFWLPVLVRFSAKPSFLHIVRNPLEVVASLNTRNGITPAHGHLIWLRHVLDAEAVTRRHERCFVFYQDLLSDWTGVADRIAKRFHIEWPQRPDDAAGEIGGFLTPALRHHRFTEDDIERRDNVPQWCAIVYRGLEKLARRNSEPVLRAFDEVRGELDVAARAFGPLAARNLTMVSQALRANETALVPEVSRIGDRVSDVEKRLAGVDRIEALVAELNAVARNVAERLDLLENGQRRQESAEKERLGLLEQSTVRFEVLEKKVAALQHLAKTFASLAERMRARDQEIDRVRDLLRARDLEDRALQLDKLRKFREIAEATDS